MPYPVLAAHQSERYPTTTAPCRSSCYSSYQTWERHRVLRDRYRGWMSWGVEKEAEESLEIDIRILGWTVSALGDDNSLETLFEAVPGFFNSKLAKDLERDFSPQSVLGCVGRFMARTLSSNSVTEAAKSCRVIVCRDIMNTILYSDIYMRNNLYSYVNQAPVSIDRVQAMA